MLEDKLTLIQCVAILHAETIYVNAKGDYHKLIADASRGVKTPETVSDGDERATLVYLKRYIDDILAGDKVFDTRALLSGLSVYSAFDKASVKSISDMVSYENDKRMSDEEKQDEARKTIHSISDELYRVVNRAKFRRQCLTTLSQVDDPTISIDTLIETMRLSLEASRPKAKRGKPSSFIASASTIEDGSIGNVMLRSKDVISGKSLKTGWKGINDMLGINGGVRPGECIVIPALPHNAKTTFSLSMFVSMAYFNKAEDFVPTGKKGLWCHFSLENELEINMPIIYRMIKEHETGEAVDITNLPTDEAESYIKNAIRKNGWDIVFERHVGSDFGIKELRDSLESFEQDNYYIVGVLMDYAGEAKMTGLGNGQSGSEVRDFYRRFKDTGSCRDAVMMSPHQLSPAAKAFRAMDPLNYVRNLPGKGYYDRCTTVDNVVDLELFIGIQDREDASWLEIQRGKHRTIVDTPVSKRYTAMKFADVGILPWDLDKEELLTVRNITSSQGGIGDLSTPMSWAA
ncbi:MAG: DnaB family ATPase [Clostridium sp.]|uniref:DnaB family ATPase n=1 Tax=Clostridium sp. TaxID=1506 RepID=UPI003EE566CA